MANKSYTWKTQKANNGTYFGIVIENVSRETKNAKGTYCDTTVLLTLPANTRAKAKLKAIKWVRYYRAKLANGEA